MREMLMLSDREEISRGLAEGLQYKKIAVALGRDPSVISREVGRHGGRAGCYRAAAADEQAHARVFGDAASGAYLIKFSWTNIARHVPVAGGASPDDPDLAEYWAARRRRIEPPLDGYTLRLLAKQNGRCPFCGDELLSVEQPPQSPHEWERWWL